MAEVTRNTLDANQKLRLTQAILGDADRIRRGDISQLDYAAELTRRLGFRITPGNVGGQARSVGVTWKRTAPSGDSTRFGPRVTARDLYPEILAIRAILFSITSNLGLKPEPTWNPSHETNQPDPQPTSSKSGS